MFGQCPKEEAYIINKYIKGCLQSQLIREYRLKQHSTLLLPILSANSKKYGHHAWILRAEGIILTHIPLMEVETDISIVGTI